MLDILLRYGHFLGILGLVSMAVCQNVLLKPAIPLSQLRLLTRLDGLYGFFAMLTLACGLSLWFWVGKPASFYTGNPVFHVKVTLFVAVGLLSLLPTVKLARLRRAHRGQPAEQLITMAPALLWVKRSELVFIAVIPLLAVLMAQGIGL